MTEVISNQIEEIAAEPLAEPVAYDTDKHQRFEFTVKQGGETFDTAHVFRQPTDERWVEFLKAKKVRGNDDAVESEENEAIADLWADLIVNVENVEIPEGQTLADLIGFEEKRDALEYFLAVAAFDPEAKGGVRRLEKVPSRIVLTEARQDGEIVTQEHKLRAKSLEDIKRYESILRRRFKTENVRGLRKKAKVEFVPQDDKFAALYDDMLFGVAGFTTYWVPMRFKVAVIHHVFASELDEKK